LIRISRTCGDKIRQGVRRGEERRECEREREREGIKMDEGRKRKRKARAYHAQSLGLITLGCLILVRLWNSQLFM
jgi:hypothetical protein